MADLPPSDYNATARDYVKQMRNSGSLSHLDVAILNGAVNTFKSVYAERLNDDIRKAFIDASDWFRAVAKHAANTKQQENTNWQTAKEATMYKALFETGQAAQSRLERDAKIAYVLSAVLLAALAATVVYALGLRGQLYDVPPPPPPPPAPLPSPLPSPPPTPPRYALVKGELPLLQQCFKIHAPVEGGMLSGGIPMEDLAYSLAYHLKHNADQKIRVLCAIHVSLPYCYCVMAGVSDNETLLELYNPRIVGYSHSSRAMVQELRIGCTRIAWIERFKVVWLRFEDAQGITHERRFDGVLAYEAQYALELNEGDTSCGREKAGEYGAIWRLLRDGPHPDPSLRWLVSPAVPSMNKPNSNNGATPALESGSTSPLVLPLPNAERQ